MMMIMMMTTVCVRWLKAYGFYGKLDEKIGKEIFKNREKEPLGIIFELLTVKFE